LSLDNYTIERVDRRPGSIFIVMRESLSKNVEDKPPTYEQIYGPSSCGGGVYSANNTQIDLGSNNDQTEHGDTIIHNSFVFKVN
jgi:hypothetical protein